MLYATDRTVLGIKRNVKLAYNLFIFFRYQNLGFNEYISIVELGQYFCANTHPKNRIFNRRRGVKFKFPKRPMGRLHVSVQICLFYSDRSTTVLSVKTVQLVLKYFDRHSYDTVVNGILL